MSISSRQSTLFAGETWQSLYTAFKQINFNASDPVSINQALQAYIQVNYPEQFNDWIVSSEFVALIDLLSWLAGTLAFRTDIAARENFIDTAESRESILRLARFLSYNPSRNQPSTGILKLTSVSTNDDVFDSFGVNQANNTILWNDPTNANWFEQFISVMNNAFVGTNPFGIPLQAGTVSNVATQLYRLNGLASTSDLSFSSAVSGIAMDFEVCNAAFADGGVLFEQTPDPNAAGFNLYYLNDGQGNASARTGFFLLFKQGSTQTQLFNITVPIENQLLDVNTTSINETDVWVQTVDDTGDVLINWTIVPAILNSNITYNNIPVADRNICSIITRDNDQITVRFSDGQFGNAPSGNVQITYRVSNGLSYQINPLEIDNITLTLLYNNSQGVQKTLSVTFSLFESVANSAVAETVEQIRQRAPQVYATQNRMVSGEDYNSFPLSSNLAAKISAVNRVYSGQSRYIDLNDPTGTYQDLSLFADDGIFFRDANDTYLEIPASLSLTTAQIMNNYLLPSLNQYTTVSVIRDVLMQAVLNGSIVSHTNTWTTATANLFQTSGWFSATDNLVQPGAIIQFSISGTATWVAVISVTDAITAVPPTNVAGPVTLSQEVPTGSTVLKILPSASIQPSAAVQDTIVAKLGLRLSFTLLYDYSNGGSSAGPIWVVGSPQNDFGTPEPSLSGTQVLIMTVNYLNGLWQINSRGLRLVFESISDIEWFDNGARGLSQLTGEAVQDTVRILRINRNLNDTAGFGLPIDYNLAIDRVWFYPDGTEEPRRTTVTLFDSNLDGYPDSPDTYYKIIQFGFLYLVGSSASIGATNLTLTQTTNILIGNSIAGVGIPSGTVITNLSGSVITISNPITANLAVGAQLIIGDVDQRNTYLFWSNAANPPYDEPLFTVIAYDTDTLLQAANPADGTVGFQVSSTDTFLLDETFWVYNATADTWTQDTTGTYRMARGRGPNIAFRWVSSTGMTIPSGDSLIFQWRHYAQSDHRLDPAQTNIIDIFVLTFAYDSQVRQWITNGADATSMPTPPTELDLSLGFSSLESFKMFSDQIVWRPVQYKYLFGTGANPELQAQFKVVRVPNATISDGEIQSRIITAIDAYFAVGNWDFGETFYYTELAAYIHQQLAGLIGSVVLVPQASDAAFGDGFEVACLPNEIFISTAQVSDIILINSNTSVNLRIRAT